MGDVSNDYEFIEDGDFIKIGETKETRLICTYNVTSTTEATKLTLYSEQFTAMEVDGIDVNVADSYTFTTTGEHNVKYTLKMKRF